MNLRHKNKQKSGQKKRHLDARIFGKWILKGQRQNITHCMTVCYKNLTNTKKVEKGTKSELISAS